MTKFLVSNTSDFWTDLLLFHTKYKHIRIKIIHKFSTGILNFDTIIIINKYITNYKKKIDERTPNINYRHNQ